MQKILVIDDDIYIGDVLDRALKAEGYQVKRAYSGTEAVFVLQSERPDLVLLDLMLPGLSGEEVLPMMKGIPVIVVSAKADVDSKVNNLLTGAADYVTKPFEIRELLARIRVQLRNLDCGEDEDGRRNRQDGEGREKSTKLIYDDITLDTDSMSVTIGEHPVSLTRTEYAILKLLMEHLGRVITKSFLLDAISEDTPDCTEGSLKQHVSNLRGKLSEINGKKYIETIWGIGFKIG